MFPGSMDPRAMMRMTSLQAPLVTSFAVLLVKSMDDWKPAKVYGLPVLGSVDPAEFTSVL